MQKYLAKIPLIFSRLCRKWQGRDGFMCKVCFLFYPPQLCLFSIFSRTKPLYLPVHVLFLLGIWKEFLGKQIFFILQIKVRHKVLNRSERVKYMYTCILFVDLTMMIKIQPVGCPVAISLSVRPILFVKSITSISILCLSFLLKLQPHSVFWLEIRFDLEPIVWIKVKV